MAPCSIISFQIDGETMEIVTDFIFLGYRITVDGHCSHEIKRCLLLWRKAMTKLDSILKIRDIILPTMVWLVKDMVFPVVMYGCESWTMKKAERQRIDAFELWCWRRLLRVPWTAKRSNQSILKEVSPEYSLEAEYSLDAEAEAPILWPPVVKNWLIGKDPDAGKDWRREEKGMTEVEIVGWHHRLDGHEYEQASGVGDGQGSLVCCSPFGHTESDTTEWLNWTELKPTLKACLINGCWILSNAFPMSIDRIIWVFIVVVPFVIVVYHIDLHIFNQLYAGQEATVRTGHGTTDWKRSTSRLYIVTLFI